VRRVLPSFRWFNQEAASEKRRDESRTGHRITQAASHLSVDEVKERMKTDARPWVRHHWWIIYNALVAPRQAEEIALHTEVSITTVHRVIATYNRWGPGALETDASELRTEQAKKWLGDVSSLSLIRRSERESSREPVVGETVRVVGQEEPIGSLSCESGKIGVTRPRHDKNVPRTQRFRSPS
jgi:hypothetical protein